MIKKNDIFLEPFPLYNSKNKKGNNNISRTSAIVNVAIPQKYTDNKGNNTIK